MRRPVLILGVLLGISLLVNLLTISRLRRKEEREASRRPGPNALVRPGREAEERPGPTDSTELQAVLREIRTLRREVAAMREGKAPSATAWEAPALGPRDPELAALLREQGAITSFWSELEEASGVRHLMSEGKYRKLVFEITARFLALDASQTDGFAATADLAFQEIAAAQNDYLKAVQGMGDGTEEESEESQRRSHEPSRQYAERLRIATARLDVFLKDTPRHRQFRENLENWVSYAGAQVFDSSNPLDPSDK